MAEALVALLGDSVEPVRSSAAECLGTTMKILGERAFNPYIEGVGEIQMGKVKDAFEKAEIKFKAGGAKVPPKAAVKSAPGKAAPGAVKKASRESLQREAIPDVSACRKTYAILSAHQIRLIRFRIFLPTYQVVRQIRCG